MTTQEYLGQKIAQRRRELKISQETVLDYADISIATLSNLEQGKGNQTIKTLTKVLDYLGLELDVKVKER